VKVAIAGALFPRLSSLVFMGREKWAFATSWKLGLRTKISRKPKVSSLIDLPLAMTVSFAGMTLTLHKSRIHCSCIMRWWLMSLHFT